MKRSTSRTTRCEHCCRDCSRPRACSATRPRSARRPTSGSKQLSHTIYASDRQQAAEAVAQALAEGFSPEAVGEAISLAANQLVLHDPGRKKEERRQADRQRPRGLGRRACLRCRQRLAEHRSREQPPQHDGQHDRRRLSHGRAGGRPQSQAVPVCRTSREDPLGRTRRAARRGRNRHQGQGPGSRLCA